MAVVRILCLCMLLSCSEAMFKRDMRTVMEDEFPDLRSWGDAVSKAASKAKTIINKGQEAVEDIKDMALDTFEAAAGKVNQSLKMVGQEVRDMNSTAMKEILQLDEKVKLAKDKAAVFAAGTSEVLEKVQPIFEQFLDQLRSVTKMATELLSSLHQDKAMSSLDKAMDSVYVTADSWKAAMQDLANQLQQMNRSLSSQGQGDQARETRRETRRQRGDGNASNQTEALAPEPPVLLSLDPVEDLSKTLKGPMQQLKSAASKLNDLAEEVTGAMGNFVDGAIEAAEKKIPKALMANVTEVLKGVQAEAKQELEPLGDVGKGIVGGIYQAGSDAGLDFGSFGFRSAQLPLTLLGGLAVAIGAQCF